MSREKEKSYEPSERRLLQKGRSVRLPFPSEAGEIENIGLTHIIGLFEGGT